MSSVPDGVHVVRKGLFAVGHPPPSRVPHALGVAIVFALGAGLRYPGGTLLTASSAGYSLTHNFLSDLGMTVAYDGRPNVLGAIFFALSLLILVFAFCGSIFGLVRQYQTVPAARRWAVAAAVLVPLAGVAFAGVAVTPENRVMGLHVDATLFAWRAFAGAAFLLTVASVVADSDARQRTVALVTLTIALVECEGIGKLVLAMMQSLDGRLTLPGREDAVRLTYVPA